MTAVDRLWNINIHYDALLDSQVPPGFGAFSTSGAAPASLLPAWLSA